MSGLASRLIVIGGTALSSLVRATQSRKISGDRFLLEARLQVRNILFESKEHSAFVEFNGVLNTIETLETETGAKWKPIRYEGDYFINMAAVLFQNKIVVFGGNRAGRRKMNVFSSEAKLERDRSQDSIIPKENE